MPGSRHTTIVSILLFFSVFHISTEAIEKRYLFQSTPHHFIQPLIGGSQINWTGGFLFTRASARLPRIIFDPSHPDYNSPDTERTLTDARARARDGATEQASIQLTDSVLSLVLNAGYTIRDKMTQSAPFRERMGNLGSLFQVASRRTGEGFVEMDLALPLFGEGGLYDLIGTETDSPMEVPTMKGPGGNDRITGVIIDLTLHPEFQPSLFPEIFNDRGRKIFSAEMVNRSLLVNRGPVAYYTSESRARKDSRLGISPYYLVAAGVIGKNRSNVFLDLEDVARILSSKGGADALRRGAVVLIVNPPEGTRP